MTIEFELARALTPQSKWYDPRVIKGGKTELTADDVRMALDLALTDHPFAYYALMWKWCQDESCKWILQEKLNEEALLSFHKLQPNDSITGANHWELIKYAVQYFSLPAVGQRMGDQGVADHMKVHSDTFRTRYKAHFNRVAGHLFDLELVALQNFKRVMRRDD